MTRDDDESDGDDRPITADGGRIVLDEHERGVLWRGRELRRAERRVIAVVKDFPYAKGRDVLDSWFRYDAPGIAPLAFLGYPDGGNVTGEELREVAKRGEARVAVLAEVLPNGMRLADVAPLTEAEVVRLGLALCDTAIAWIERRGSASVGLRPETIYVTGEAGRRTYPGATPRVFALVGNGDLDDSFPPTYYDSPLAASANELDGHDIGYVIALVLSFAATGEHAYRHRQYVDEARAPFRGPRELGALLAAALDTNERMTVASMRERLSALTL